MAEERARYGVDAPAVMLGLIGGGAVGVAAGGTALAIGQRAATRVPGALVAAGATVPLALGLAMGAYTLAGKRRTRDWILARHDWRGAEVVLDIGAGRGLLAIAAARRVPRGRVIAVDRWNAGDLSGNGPEALSRNAEVEGVADRLEIVSGDARALDLPDASVDVVLSLLCLHNIEPAADRARALREIARVLKPGGRALIADYTGTASYARVLAEAELQVTGPVSGVRQALSLMALVEAVRPG